MTSPSTLHQVESVIMTGRSMYSKGTSAEDRLEEILAEDLLNRKTSENSAKGSSFTADAQRDSGDDSGPSANSDRSETHLPIDILNLSHHSLDADALNMFADDNSLGGGFSISSFAFHDSQEQITTKSVADRYPSETGAGTDSSGKVPTLYVFHGDEGNAQTRESLHNHHPAPNQALGQDVSENEHLNTMDLNEITAIMAKESNSGQNQDKDYKLKDTNGDSYEMNSFAENGLPPSSSLTVDQTLSDDPLNSSSDPKHPPIVFNGGNLPFDTATLNVPDQGSTQFYNSQSLENRPDSKSAQVSESETQVSASSALNDLGHQNSDSAFHSINGNTLIMDKEGMSQDFSVDFKNFMQKSLQTFSSDNTNQKSAEEIIRQQHMQSFMKFKEENFPQTEQVSPRRVPQSFLPNDMNQNSADEKTQQQQQRMQAFIKHEMNEMSVEERIRQQHKLSFMKYQEENFPKSEQMSQRRVPMSMQAMQNNEARQGRRFSMPTLPTSEKYMAPDVVNPATMGGSALDSRFPITQTVENPKQMQDPMSSAYSYSGDNGEPSQNNSVSLMNRKRQDRRMSMPTFSSSTDFQPTAGMMNQNMYGTDMSDNGNRRRQARRLSNESLSSSIHEHVAHANLVDNVGQFNLRNSLDAAATARRIQSRRFSNDSMASMSSSFRNNMVIPNSMEGQPFMNQQGGMQFFPNSADIAQRQGRRFSMPTFSSNLDTQANMMGFQNQQMMRSNSGLVPMADNMGFQPNNRMRNGVPTMVNVIQNVDSQMSMYQPEFGPNSVISAADRELATDFSYAVLVEIEACTFGKQDRTGKRRSLPLGFQGLACRHCRGLSKIGGRLFPSTIKTMSDTNKTLMALYNHLIKCPVCPNTKKRYLQYLKESHDDERKSKRYGSQKALFSKIWTRLHGKGPPI
jgi:hypothetical protein